MQKPLPAGPAATPLDDLGVIRAHGPDAVKFLQGQLSNDVTRLADGQAMLAGLHNPQGRTIALLRLVRLGPEEILAILPRELVASVIGRLSKYVLRAKVKLSDVSQEWRVSGVVVPSITDLMREPHRIAISIGTSPARWWLITPTTEPSIPPGHAPLDRETWRALDIEQGLPQVYAATTEEFVAQMLNLDELDAIAFDKGCYTGQEVIARAHYRGRVKRRLQRFHAPDARLVPGDSGTLPDGRTFKVVEAVCDATGCDFLAVAPLTPGDSSAEDMPTG